MKKVYNTLFLFLLTTITFAQGIAVQGIARDNNKAALPQKVLNFTFKIVSEGGAQRYTEDASIRTDNFGVFSHIVGTGTKLNNVNFSEQGLKIEVSILYPTKVVVYNESFNYTPYAHYAKQATNADNATNATNATNSTNAVTAANGVPTGTVVAFMGDDNKIPAGWTKCDGKNISGSQYAALRGVIGNTLPDLRARYLRGQGTSSNIDIRRYDENTSVRQYLDQTIVGHNHSFDVTKETNRQGNHRHEIRHRTSGTPGSIDGGGANEEWGHQYSGDEEGANNANFIKRTRATGEHSHGVRINGDTSDLKSIQNGGVTLAARGEENRPYTVVVNYIIKL